MLNPFRDSSGAAAQAALTDENVKKIVEHVATLVRANQRQQAGDLIEQAAEQQPSAGCTQPLARRAGVAP